MFTGIVQGKGKIIDIIKNIGLMQYAIEFPSHMMDGLKEGASVSVDGVCQTVISMTNHAVWFDSIQETLDKTTLQELRLGQAVNLERSCRFGDEIGGHLLSGHIDCKALLVSIMNNRYFFECSSECIKYIFLKGSIALDGVSLTISHLDAKHNRFAVDLIPETLKRTTLSAKSVHDLVNVEIDFHAKIIVETLERTLVSRFQDK